MSNAWVWTVFELMTFPFDNTMIDIARNFPLTSSEDLIKETKQIVMERGFRSIYS